MAKFPSFEIPYTIVCDDVRKEDNGKWIYIGVYPVDIVPSEFPANLVLRFVFRVKPKRIGKTQIEVRILLDDAVIAGMNGGIQNETLEADNFPTPPMLLGLMGPDKIVLQMREADGEWRTVHSVNAKRAPAPPGA